MQANVDLSLEDLIRQQKAAAAKPAAPKPVAKPPAKFAKAGGYKGGKGTSTNGSSPKPGPGSSTSARPSTPTVDLRRTLKASGPRVSSSGKPDNRKAVDLRQTLSLSTRPASAAQGKVASAITDDLRSVLASRKSGSHHHATQHAAPAQKQHQQQRKQWPKQGPGMTKIQVVVGPNGRREVRQAREPVKISIVNDRVATPEPARPVPNAAPTVVERPAPLSLSFVPAPQPAPPAQPAVAPAPPAQQRSGLIVISPPGYSTYQPPVPHQPYRQVHVPRPHGMPHTMAPPTMGYHSTGVPGYPGHFTAPPVAAPPVPALAPVPLVSSPPVATPAPGLSGIPIHTIRIGNLHPKTTAEELRRHFSDFGEIVDVQLVSSPEGKQLGIALISYTSETACSAAIRQFNNILVDGFRLKVGYHKVRADSSSSTMATSPLPLASQAHPMYRR